MKKLKLSTTKEDITIESETGKTVTLPWDKVPLDAINQLREFSVPIAGAQAYHATCIEVGDYTPVHNLVLTL